MRGLTGSCVGWDVMGRHGRCRIGLASHAPASRFERVGLCWLRASRAIRPSGEHPGLSARRVGKR